MNEKGLDNDQIQSYRAQYGSNKLDTHSSNNHFKIIGEIISEPMFILLSITCIIYWAVGDQMEGVVMAIALLLVASISWYQEVRSQNAIATLKKMTAGKVSVIRNGFVQTVDADDIVVQDIVLLSEGELVPADGMILESRDLSVNESVITGESFPVNKAANGNDLLYRGTLLVGGTAKIRITAVGNKTMFGLIGISLQSIKPAKTPLQLQISRFVFRMAWIGSLAFVTIVGYVFFTTGDFIHALLKGLSLAMSILPEEIPVAFSTFQALGAFRLLKENKVIVKQPHFVETLGSATVICSDKTGTLTKNEMSLTGYYDHTTQISNYHSNTFDQLPASLIEYAMWSSETDPYDPMEKAIHEAYEKSGKEDKRKQHQQIHEYPLSGTPPMMTHLFSDENGNVLIAMKGAPEAILKQSNLDYAERLKILDIAQSFAKNGWRVLGVGKGSWKEKKWPSDQTAFSCSFLGLVAFEDPPKEKIKETIQIFHRAGIKVLMVTGDFPETAVAIANKIGISEDASCLTGKEMMQMDVESLKKAATNVMVYARMFPEAKLKLIEALKESGEIVAMTGDGVNDAPALQAAHIGIAMGDRGSEVARSAAALILTDDDLFHMTEAVALGRKIYANLKKAIQYIISIHIPILLIVLIPLLLNWAYPFIFSPVHVIFLELIMGPTCSIVYENEPATSDVMLQPPLKKGINFLNLRQLSISILQGSVIAFACLLLGYYFMLTNATEEKTRTMIFFTLIISNVFLTLINRSFTVSFFKTIQYKNQWLWLVVLISLVLLSVMNYVPFINHIFGLTPIVLNEWLIVFMTAACATFWMEPFKAYFFRKS